MAKFFSIVGDKGTALSFDDNRRVIAVPLIASDLKQHWYFDEGYVINRANESLLDVVRNQVTLADPDDSFPNHHQFSFSTSTTGPIELLAQEGFFLKITDGDTVVVDDTFPPQVFSIREIADSDVSEETEHRHEPEANLCSLCKVEKGDLQGNIYELISQVRKLEGTKQALNEELKNLRTLMTDQRDVWLNALKAKEVELQEALSISHSHLHDDHNGDESLNAHLRLLLESKDQEILELKGGISDLKIQLATSSAAAHAVPHTAVEELREEVEKLKAQITAFSSHHHTTHSREEEEGPLDSSNIHHNDDQKQSLWKRHVEDARRKLIELDNTKYQPKGWAENILQWCGMLSLVFMVLIAVVLLKMGVISPPPPRAPRHSPAPPSTARPPPVSSPLSVSSHRLRSSAAIVS